MAYLVDIVRPKCNACSSYATHELHNRLNAIIGRYCKRHATYYKTQHEITEQARLSAGT